MKPASLFSVKILSPFIVLGVVVASLSSVFNAIDSLRKGDDFGLDIDDKAFVEIEFSTFDGFISFLLFLLLL